MRTAQKARTMGFRRIAIRAATMNTNTAPFTAETNSHAPTTTSGRPTSWIHRGITMFPGLLAGIAAIVTAAVPGQSSRAARAQRSG